MAEHEQTILGSSENGRVYTTVVGQEFQKKMPPPGSRPSVQISPIERVIKDVTNEVKASLNLNG